MTLSINLLGPTEIYLENDLLLRFRTRKAQALLIYLAVTNRSWTRDLLATLFWPETDDTSARKNLRDILPPLRRQLKEYLLIEDEVIGLNLSSPYKCDALQFGTVLAQQHAHIDTDLLAQTLQLYRGEFLEGFATSRISIDFELWALREREHLRQLALLGFTTLCQRQQEHGAYEAALRSNQELLRLVPWDETSHRRQMLLLAQVGQQTAALAHFDICRQMLAEELDAEPDAETVALYEQIKAGHVRVAPRIHVAPPIPTPTSTPTAATPELQLAPHNLPRQLTSLIGRADEIDALQRLLHEESTALLTLVGQGGVGKTRLALAVAQKLRQSNPRLFPDGIWFVSLAGILPGDYATEQIAGAIVQAMDLSLSGSDPISKQLIRALAAQQLLLVLDNIEHLVTERTFLFELLQSAQQVKILTTSREPLRLHAEHLHPVVGLPVPAAHLLEGGLESARAIETGFEQNHPRQPPSDLRQYAGVELFVTRIQQRLPEFQLTVQNQRHIGRICRLLGGVPLGLELSAQLYVEEGPAILPQLIDEMERLDPLEEPPPGLDHLRTPAIDLPARQRSIRTLFDHSWRLLRPTEQNLLRHCAIFRGGFTRHAILTIGSGDGSTLLALVTKSLVRYDSHDRYDLHELVRQYVIEQFQQSATATHTVAQKHATYFAERLAEQEERLYQQPDSRQVLQIELYNLRAMWHWFTERTPLTQTSVALLNRCLPAFFHFLWLTAQRPEALRMARQALETLRPSLQTVAQNQERTRLLGYLLANAAEAGVRTEERTTVKKWVDEAKAIGEADSDGVLLTQVYLTLAIIDASGANHHIELFDHALNWATRATPPFWQTHVLLTAIPHWVTVSQTQEKATLGCETLLRIINARDYQCLWGDALLMQGMVYLAHGEYERTIETVDKALAACKSGQGSTLAIRMSHEVLGKTYMQLRNHSEAQKWAEVAYRQSKIEGNQLSVLHNLHTMSFVQTQLKNWDVAASYAQELITSAEEIDATQFIIFGYMRLGMLHNHQQHYKEGIFYYQKAAALAKQANYPVNWAVSLSGIANAYLFQERFNEAYNAIAPLLVDDTLFSFPSRSTFNLAAITYRILTARQDPRADTILERVYALLQSELAKFTDPKQRAAFIENDAVIQNIMRWWRAKHDTVAAPAQPNSMASQPPSTY